MDENKIRDLIGYLKDKHEEEGVVIASGIDVLVDGLEEGYIAISNDLNIARERNDFSDINKLAGFLEVIDVISGYLKIYSEDLFKNFEENK